MNTTAWPADGVFYRIDASDGSIVSYDWTFGDGDAASGEIVDHAYAGPGTYAGPGQACSGYLVESGEVVIIVRAASKQIRPGMSMSMSTMS